MLFRRGKIVFSGIFNAIFRPSSFVTSQASVYTVSRRQSFIYCLQLMGVWAVNVALYSVPLTLAGVGTVPEGGSPAWFQDLFGPIFKPDILWEFLTGIVVNSSYLTIATGLLFISLHTGILLMGESRGFLQSLHTVIYSTSVYLAGIFTIVMVVATTEGLSVTEEILIRFQSNIITGVLELVNLNVEIQGTQPGPIIFNDISYYGELILGLLIVLVFYFIYSVYLGVRINHEFNRFKSLITLIMIGMSPLIYIIGSVIVQANLNRLGIQIPF